MSSVLLAVGILLYMKCPQPQVLFYEVWLPNSPASGASSASHQNPLALRIQSPDNVPCSSGCGSTARAQRRRGRRAGLPPARPGASWRGRHRQSQRQLSNCSGPLRHAQLLAPGPGRGPPFAGGFRPGGLGQSSQTLAGRGPFRLEPQQRGSRRVL